MSAEPLFTPPPKLTERQKYVLDIVQARQQVHALQAGAELHRRKRCSWCKPDMPCQYAESEGREVLRSLKKKGLLRMNRQQVYRLASTEQLQDDGANQEIPF